MYLAQVRTSNPDSDPILATQTFFLVHFGFFAACFIGPICNRVSIFALEKTLKDEIEEDVEVVIRKKMFEKVETKQFYERRKGGSTSSVSTAANR